MSCWRAGAVLVKNYFLDGVQDQHLDYPHQVRYLRKGEPLDPPLIHARLLITLGEWIRLDQLGRNGNHLELTVFLSHSNARFAPQMTV